MNSVASEPVLIGVDWGTSSLRAFLIGAQGEILEKVASPQGIMHVEGQAFEAVLDRLVAGWMTTSGLPIVASGMITSRNGWVETPYATLPLGESTLGQDLRRHEAEGGAVVHFVTGASTDHAGHPDVMRGEETQIIGAASLGLSDGTFVMPGTHSKWVKVAEGKITDFSTYMTGELFAALKGHTILGTLMQDGAFDPAAFAMGVRAGIDDAPNLLHNLFHVRTLPLMGRISGDAAADYMSGLLIGTEVAAALGAGEEHGAITVVGRTSLADRYEIALRSAGLGSHRAPEDVVARGHFLIAGEGGLLP